MNIYERYNRLATTDTPFSRCASLKHSLMMASVSQDIEVRRRFLSHGLAQVEKVREEIIRELGEL